MLRVYTQTWVFIVEALLQQGSGNKVLELHHQGGVQCVCNHTKFFNYYEGMYPWNGKIFGLLVWDDFS